MLRCRRKDLRALIMIDARPSQVAERYSETALARGQNRDVSIDRSEELVNLFGRAQVCAPDFRRIDLRAAVDQNPPLRTQSPGEVAALVHLVDEMSAARLNILLDEIRGGAGISDRIASEPIEPGALDLVAWERDDQLPQTKQQCDAAGDGDQRLVQQPVGR